MVGHVALTLDVALAAGGVEGVEVEHGGEARHARQDQLGAAAKADGAVGIDAADGHFELGVDDIGVEVERRAVGQRPQPAQVPGHEIVGRDLIFGHDVASQLFLFFLLRLGAVRPAADHKADFAFGDARFGQFTEHIGDQLRGGCGTAAIVHDDGRAALAAGQFGDARRAERVRKRGFDARGVQLGRILRRQHVDLPLGRKVEREVVVAIPGARRHGDLVAGRGR